MKKKGFGLVAACLSAAFAVLAFIGMAFKFVATTYKMSGGGMSHKESYSADMGEWIDMLESGADKMEAWQVARVLMIIALLVIVAVAVLAIVQLFVENKALALATKITSIVSIVLTAVFFICFFIGGAVLWESNSASGVTTSLEVLPSAGPILMALFGILAAVFALLSNKKKKAK